MRPLVLALALLLTTSVANADEQIRQPPTLRDAAKAHFRDGLAFFQSEQFGPAIVEFRAAWELSGERDLLYNLSWACEKAGRVIEAKDYASRYLAQSRGTEDEAMAERRVKFLSGRYPNGQPSVQPPLDAGPSQGQSIVPQSLPDSVVQNPTPTPVKAATTSSTTGNRRLAVGLIAGGGTALAIGIGLGAGAIATWAESQNPDTYYDRWLSLNSTSRTLTITATVTGVAGASLLGAGLYLTRTKQ